MSSQLAHVCKVQFSIMHACYTGILKIKSYLLESKIGYNRKMYSNI